MKTIVLIDLLAPLSEFLQQAQKEALILQTPDGKEFLLATLNDFAHEVELTRQNPALIALLDQRGQEEVTVKLSSLVKPVNSSVESTSSVDLEGREIDIEQAADLRSRLKTFAEDWDSPEMNIY